MTETVHLQLGHIPDHVDDGHIVTNAALDAIDALTQLAVIDRDLAAPPGSPAHGDRYIVASGGSGAWLNHDSEVALWLDGAWRFFVPKAGWRAWVEDEAALVVFHDGAWEVLASLGS